MSDNGDQSLERLGLRIREALHPQTLLDTSQNLLQSVNLELLEREGTLGSQTNTDNIQKSKGLTKRYNDYYYVDEEEADWWNKELYTRAVDLRHWLDDISNRQIRPSFTTAISPTITRQWDETLLECATRKRKQISDDSYNQRRLQQNRQPQRTASVDSRANARRSDPDLGRAAPYADVSGVQPRPGSDEYLSRLEANERLERAEAQERRERAKAKKRREEAEAQERRERAEAQERRERAKAKKRREEAEAQERRERAEAQERLERAEAKKRRERAKADSHLTKARQQPRRSVTSSPHYPSESGKYGRTDVGPSRAHDGKISSRSSNYPAFYSHAAVNQQRVIPVPGCTVVHINFGSAPFKAGKNGHY